MREDWEIVKLGEFATNEKGKKPKNQKTEQDEVFKYPYVTIAAFEKGIIETYTDGERCRFCFEDDFLMVWDGSRSGLVGKGMNGALGSTIVRINFPGIENDYAYHFLSSKYQEINTRAKGSGTPHVDPYLLWNYDFSICSLPEQRAIVAKIEELFSDLDKGIADLKKAQDQLKVYRQAVLKKAFEGDFTKSWRDSKKLNSDWTTYTFAEITESLKRGPFGGDLKKSFFVENGYAVYEQQHAINNDFTTIRYHIDQERYKKLKACNVGPGDYIVSCSGTMGKIARLPKGSPNGVINQALLRIRINESIISHEYFLEYFRSALFQRKILKDSRGSGMQNMAGIKEIKPIRIKVPTLLEQSQIIKEIESRLSICNKVEISITESLEKAEVLRQSILKKAFEGTLLSQEEIAACKAAPDYEPASVLLEKIKEEKEKKELEEKIKKQEAEKKTIKKAKKK